MSGDVPNALPADLAVINTCPRQELCIAPQVFDMRFPKAELKRHNGARRARTTELR